MDLAALFLFVLQVPLPVLSLMNNIAAHHQRCRPFPLRGRQSRGDALVPSAATEVFARLVTTVAVVGSSIAIGGVEPVPLPASRGLQGNRRRHAGQKRNGTGVRFTAAPRRPAAVPTRTTGAAGVRRSSVPGRTETTGERIRWRGSPRMGEVGPRDFLHYDHCMKTGGSSLSEHLEAIAGGSAVVLPGGGRSHYLDIPALSKAIQDASDRGVSRTSLAASFRVAFCHCPFEAWTSRVGTVFPELMAGIDDVATKYPYPYSGLGVLGGDISTTGNMPRRLHRITVLRDPERLLASHFNEWVCSVKEHTARGGTAVGNSSMTCHPDMGEVRRHALAKAVGKCMRRNHTPDDALPRAGLVRYCRQEAEERAGFCDDPVAFLDSSFFEKFFGRNNSWLFRTICGRSTSVEDCYSNAMALFHQHLLVGTTERMRDMQCLLHFYTRAPWTEMPHSRKSACDPLALWSEKARIALGEVAVKTRAVHKAANDVLNYRLTEAASELAELQHANVVDKGDWNNMRHIGPGCFLSAAT